MLHEHDIDPAGAALIMIGLRVRASSGIVPLPYSSPRPPASFARRFSRTTPVDSPMTHMAIGFLKRWPHHQLA
jgi:hypothetical protein